MRTPELVDTKIKELEKEKESKIYNLSSSHDKKKLEKIFQENVALGLRAVGENDPGFAEELCDSGRPFVNKRFDTILHYIQEAKERFSEKYPNVSIEEEFVAVNATYNTLTYDSINWSDYIILAATLWILDELQTRGKLHLVFHLLPDEEETKDIRIPEYFTDSCYDTKIVKGFLYIIQNRNDDIEYKKSRIPLDKTLINKASLQRSQKKSQYPNISEDDSYECYSNRQKFDYIISLLHPVVVERAIKRFEEKIWVAFDNYLSCIFKYRKEYLELIDDYIDNLHDYKKSFLAVQKINEERAEKANNIKKGYNVLSKQLQLDDYLATFPILPSSTGALSPNRIKEEKDLNRGLQAIKHFEEKRDNINSYCNALKYLVGSPDISDAKMNDDYMLELIPDIKSLHRFDISNPYELCFALLYLIDSGNELPWLCPLGIMVMQNTAKLLPWHRPVKVDLEDCVSDEKILSEEEFKERFSEKPEENAIEEQMCDEPTPLDWSEEESKLYEQKYFFPEYDHSTKSYNLNDNVKVNLPQFIFSQARVALPRAVFQNSDMEEIYKLAGFDDKESELLRYFIILANSKHINELTGKIYDIFNEPDEVEDESQELYQIQDNDDANLIELRNNYKLLKDELKRIHEQKSNLIKESLSLKQKNDELLKELSELRTLVRKRTSKNGTEVIEKITTIEFPYIAKKRYVVFGGHDSWARAIKPLLRNVRFVAADERPNLGLISNSYAVWFQSNALGHSDYYKVIDYVRIHNIRHNYFTYGSAEKCAEQLALYDLRQDSNGE